MLRPPHVEDKRLESIAEIILVLHFLVILFLVIGFPVGLIINHRGFRYFHCLILAVVTLLTVLHLPCPLTLLEELFAKVSYEGSFLGTWLNRIIYPQWIERQQLFMATVVFAIVVFSSFYWYPLKKTGSATEELLDKNQ